MNKKLYIASFLATKDNNVYHGIRVCMASSYAEAYGMIKKATINDYLNHTVHICNVTSVESIIKLKPDIQEFESK